MKKNAFMFTLILLLSISIALASDNEGDSFSEDCVSNNTQLRKVISSTPIEQLARCFSIEQIAEMMAFHSPQSSHPLEKERRAALKQEATNSQIFSHHHQTVFITLNSERSTATENHKQWAEISSSPLRNPYVIFEYGIESNKEDSFTNPLPYPSTGYHAETSRDSKNDRRQQIEYPHHWPYFLHGKLIITFKKGKGKNEKIIQNIGSASIIGTRHILTAGHCILDRYGLGCATAIKFLYAESAEENSNYIWKAIEGTHAFTVSGWKNSGKSECDYGIIVLKEPIKLPLGIVCYQTIEDNPSQLPQNGLDTGSFKQKYSLFAAQQLNQSTHVNIAGFPEYYREEIVNNYEKNHHPYRSFGLIEEQQDMLLYNIDVSKGQSGSLVWLSKENEQEYYGIGIHTQGYDPKEKTAGRNKAVRLRPSHLGNIIAWIKGSPS